MNVFKAKQAIVLVAATMAMILFGAGTAHASIVDVGPVQVGTTSSDQPSDLVAVSNGGNATATGGCVPLLPPLVPEACFGDDGNSDYPGLVAVSTTGSATGAYVAAATVQGWGCADSWAVSVSLSGNACDGVVAVSALGDASGDFLAVSGVGSAQSGGLAVTGNGPATGSSGAASLFGDATGPIAIETRSQVPGPNDPCILVGTLVVPGGLKAVYQCIDAVTNEVYHKYVPII